MEKGNARVRSIRVAVALLAMMLTATACGARLSHSQLVAARRGAGGSGTGVGAGEAATGQSAESAATGGAAAGGTGSGATGGAKAATGGAKAATGAAAASSAGGATCKAGTPSSDPGVTATEIHFGNVSTTGGPVPGIFAGARDGANAFFAYQNSQGGVCGRQLKLDFQDDNLDPSRNQQAYQQLSSKDLGIVGSFSVVDEGGSSVIGSHPDMPDVSYALSKARYGLSNNFSPQPLKVPGWPLGTLQYFKTTFGPNVITKMAYFTENVQSAKDAASGQKAAAQSLGYQIVYERVTEPTDTDFTADVSNMKSKGVQGVMMAGDAGQMARIAAAMKAQGFTVPLATWGANAYDQQFVKNSQGGAEGALISPVATALYAGEDAGSVPEVGLFNQWLKRVGGKPDFFAAMGWASARLMVQAVQTGGAPTRAAIMGALKGIHKFDSNGMLAPADPAGKVPPTCWVLIDVKGGKFARNPATPSGFRCDPGGYYG
jgi:ABC-type branched-subunit amino acid transport system substrate-binding protein